MRGRDPSVYKYVGALTRTREGRCCACFVLLSIVTRLLAAIFQKVHFVLEGEVLCWKKVYAR